MINSLTITNFRGIAHETVEFSGRTLITGRNAAGKSSVRDALELLLFGSNRHTTAAGGGAKELSGDGGTYDIAAELVTATGRVLGASLTVGAKGRELSVYDIVTGDILAKDHDGLWQVLGYNRRAAMVACRPERYITGPEMGSILTEHFGASLGVEKALEYAHTQGHTSPESQRAIAALIKEAQGPKAPETDADWRAIGQWAYDQRTGINREIKGVTKDIESYGFAVQPKGAEGQALTGADIGPIRAALKELNAQRDGLIEEKGKSAALTEATGETETAHSIEARIVVLESMNQESARDLDRLTGLLQEQRGNLDAAKGKVATAKESINTLSTARENLQRDLEATDVDCCPTCKREHTIASRAIATEEARAAIAAIDATVDQRRDEWIDATNAVKQIAAGADATLRALDDAKRALEESRSEVDHLRRRACEIRNREALAGTVRPVATIEAEIAALDERIEAGNKTLDSLRRFTERTELATRLAALEVRKGLLDWAVTAFGRKGESGAFQQSAILEPLAAFAGRVSEVSAGFGYRVRVMSDGAELALGIESLDGGKLVPLAQASNGEQTIAAIAVAATFGAGGGIACVDNIDALDGNHKRTAVEVLRGVDGIDSLVLIGHYAIPGEPDIGRIVAGITPARLVWMEDCHVRNSIGAALAAT